MQWSRTWNKKTKLFALLLVTSGDTGCDGPPGVTGPAGVCVFGWPGEKGVQGQKGMPGMSGEIFYRMNFRQLSLSV